MVSEKKYDKKCATVPHVDDMSQSSDYVLNHIYVIYD